MRRELASGDLPALILAMLSQAPLHGYAIAREVERLSDGALHMKEGTLYPALRVLEQDGLVAGAWQPQPKGADRKVYTLTEAGRKETMKRTKALRDYAATLNTVLGKLDLGNCFIADAREAAHRRTPRDADASGKRRSCQPRAGANRRRSGSKRRLAVRNAGRLRR